MIENLINGYKNKTKCQNCGNICWVQYQGDGHMNEYDGRCPKCGIGCPCDKKDLGK